MATRSNLGLLLLAASSFAGGLALGLLLTPQSGRKNREWIAQNADQMRKWADEKSKEARHHSEEKLHKISESVRDGVRHNMPDLYEATEDLTLDGDSLIDG
ncbi:MAG: YtxH domain-containing protein [Bacteroidota bacterium]